MKNQNRTGGPRTAAGKARCAKNAIKTGIYAQSHLLSDESSDDYQQHYASIYLSFKPHNTFEIALVEELAVLLWKKRRLLNYENGPIEAIKNEQLNPINIRDLIVIPDGCTWIVKDMNKVDAAFIKQYQAIHAYFKRKKSQAFTLEEIAKLEHNCPELIVLICEEAAEYLDTMREIKNIGDILIVIRHQPASEEVDTASLLEFVYEEVKSRLENALWVIEHLNVIKNAIKIDQERRIMRYLMNNKLARPTDDLNRAIGKVLDQFKMYRQNFLPAKTPRITKRTNSHLDTQ